MAHQSCNQETALRLAHNTSLINTGKAHHNILKKFGANGMSGDPTVEPGAVQKTQPERRMAPTLTRSLMVLMAAKVPFLLSHISPRVHTYLCMNTTIFLSAKAPQMISKPNLLSCHPSPLLMEVSN
jgi:hypothetical protein